MAKKKAAAAKSVRVDVVLQQNREGLGKDGDTISVGEARAARWCKEGIAKMPGEPEQPKEPKEDDNMPNGGEGGEG